MHRRLVQNAFSKAESRKFTAIQENEARKLVRRILRDPEDWKRLMRLFSTAVIMQIMTGQEVKGPDDEYVRIAEDINNAISGGPPLGASGLDVFPWLKHLPSWCDPTGSTRYVRKWAHAIHDVQVVPYERVMKEIRAGSAKPSLVADVVLEEEARAQRGESPLLTPERIQGIIGAVYGAAQETTADTLVVFTFAITMHPEVQKKAKAELNAVLGPDRLPEIADREDLPYIERVVQETFRFWPTIPLGVPRMAMEDDVYKGMLIPKGALILTNSTAITHDERVYSEPWKFDPDRYLPKDQGGRGEPMTAPHFGYGRRICPGRFTGENSVFIAIATMLHVLSFDKERDEEGNEITVNAETTDYGGGLGR
ncbi:cytochrome P450 [Schizophyllum commune Loenen D]|nr:cytochrome P450 [Schizophyllum commune Loenen D]